MELRDDMTPFEAVNFFFHKAAEIDHLSDQLYKFRREVELAKTEAHSIRTDAQMEIGDLRSRHKVRTALLDSLTRCRWKWRPSRPRSMS